MSFEKPQMLLLSGLAGIYTLAWIMQSHLFIKGDVIWLMHLAQSVFSGGHYVNDFFEVNPPLIILLYMVPLALTKILSVSNILAVRIYIFLLSSLSLIICYGLTKNLFPEKNAALRIIFILTLAFTFLILPLSEFGQRENLLFILTTPYLLLVAYRLQGQTLNIFYALGIGLLAGLGFAIKPFFLLTLALVELYYLTKQQKLFSWLRPETIGIISVFLAYAGLLAVYFKSYLLIIVPIAARYYYLALGHSWTEVILSHATLYCSLPLLFYFIFPPQITRYHLSKILLIALIGYLLCYFLQQIPWYYHLLPAFSIALLLYMLWFTLFISNTPISISSYALLAIIFFTYPGYFISEFYLFNLNLKNNLTSLITYLHAQGKNKPIYFFSSKTAYMVSVLEYAEVQHASRLQFLAWMLCYFKKLPSLEDENFFIEMLAADMNKNQPNLILIDTAKYNTTTSPLSLDYPRILKKNPHFKTAWAPYHYLTTLEKKGWYKFDVYQR